MPFYESPILIWNSKLRSILEENIKENSKEFIQELQEYAAKPTYDIKNGESMPVYT